MSSDHIAADTTVEVGGRQCKLSPLTLRDLKELEDVLRDDYWRNAVKTFEGLPPQLQEKHYAEAIKGREAIKLGSVAFEDATKSLDGALTIFWLSLKKAQPDITRDQAAEGLRFENVDDLTKKLERVMAFGNAPEKNA